MQRDFSIWQRASDVWQEAHQSALEQRLAKQAEQGIDRPLRAPSWTARLRWWLAAGSRRREVKRAAGMLVIVVALNALAGAAHAASPVQAIRAVAENILGRDTVRSVRLADEGGTVVIRWESATYRAANKSGVTRELLYAEAALTVGAILGALADIRRVHFTMVRGSQVLARGESSRVRPVTVIYEAALGGGTYTATNAPVRPAAPGGDRAAQEL